MLTLDILGNIKISNKENKNYLKSQDTDIIILIIIAYFIIQINNHLFSQLYRSFTDENYIYKGIC